MKKNKLIEVPTWSDFRKQEGLVAEKSENKTLNAFRNEASKDFLDARSIDYSKWLNLFFCIQTGKEFNKLDVIDIMGIAAERYAAYQFEQGRKEGWDAGCAAQKIICASEAETKLLRNVLRDGIMGLERINKTVVDDASILNAPSATYEG